MSDKAIKQDPLEGRVGACCFDCLRAYGTFPDLIVSNDLWNIISPTGDEGGILCPSCLLSRLQNLYPSISRFDLNGRDIVGRSA